MPTKKDVAIAWNLLHVARIETLTMNLLVNDGNQVLDESWKIRLGTKIIDTGNAMPDDEILSFSREVEKARLTAADINRKFRPEQAERIAAEGGLTEHPDSIWLRDFWGKKMWRASCCRRLPGIRRGI